MGTLSILDGSLQSVRNPLMASPASSLDSGENPRHIGLRNIGVGA
jgi:hypothetical protein